MRDEHNWHVSHTHILFRTQWHTCRLRLHANANVLDALQFTLAFIRGQWHMQCLTTSAWHLHEYCECNVSPCVLRDQAGHTPAVSPSPPPDDCMPENNWCGPNKDLCCTGLECRTDAGNTCHKPGAIQISGSVTTCAYVRFQQAFAQGHATAREARLPACAAVPAPQLHLCDARECHKDVYRSTQLPHAHNHLARVVDH